MKAGLHEYGGPEKLKFEDSFPEPQISGGTVLIEAAAASVNPIDWKLRSGMRQKDFPLSQSAGSRPSPPGPRHPADGSRPNRPLAPTRHRLRRRVQVHGR